MTPRQDLAGLVDAVCASLADSQDTPAEPNSGEENPQRNLVEKTLEALSRMGYLIPPARNRSQQPDAGVSVATGGLQVEDVNDLVNENNHASLHTLWRVYDDDNVDWTPAVYSALGAYFRRKDPLLAYEVFAAGLARFEKDQRLRYNQALTLARLGAVNRALTLGLELQAESIYESDLATDVLSLLGRLHKDRAFSFSSADARRQPMEEALRVYLSAYKKAADGCKSYPAINAATLALLLGDDALASRLARKAQVHAEEELSAGEGDPHWQVATKAEALLVLGKSEEAAGCYGSAVKLAADRFDDIASMRKNARILAAHYQGSVDWVENVFRLPAVVIFSGHMIDRPGRRRPRFPVAIEPQVAAAISEQLAALNAGFGFSGAACGSDILFLEAMANRGSTHILLPFSRDEFIQESVDVVPGGGWLARFEHVLEAATGVEVASDSPREWGGIVFEYANLLLLGLAQLRTRALGTELVGLAVYDQGPADGPGGTAATVKTWQARGIRVVQIDPSGLDKLEHVG